MDYLHELKKKERKLSNTFIMKHPNISWFCLLLGLACLLISVFLDGTDINLVSWFSIFASSIVLFFVWCKLEKNHQFYDDKLSEIQYQLFETRMILSTISTNYYKEIDTILFTPSNNIFYNNVFNNVSKIYIKRNDNYIFIKYIISGTEIEIDPISIKDALKSHLFKF